MMLGKSTLAIAAAVILAWAPGARAQGRGETVRIQDYPGIGNALFRIAIAKGYCGKHGIKCELKSIPSAPLGMQALLANSLDVALVPAEVHVNAVIKGAAVKAVAGSSGNNVFLLIGRNDLATDGKGFPDFLAALKGKKIGVPARGSAAEITMVFLAEKAGLKAGDFTFVAVGSANTAYTSVISKQVDAAMTFEPAGSMCDVLRTCKTIYRIGDATQPAELVHTTGAYDVALQSYMDEHPDVITALVAAARDAETFMHNPANLGEVVKISREFFNLKMPRSDDILEQVFKKNGPAYRVHISRKALQATADYMFATKQISAPFDASRLVNDKTP